MFELLANFAKKKKKKSPRVKTLPFIAIRLQLMRCMPLSLICVVRRTDSLRKTHARQRTRKQRQRNKSYTQREIWLLGVGVWEIVSRNTAEVNIHSVNVVYCVVDVCCLGFLAARQLQRTNVNNDFLLFRHSLCNYINFFFDSSFPPDIRYIYILLIRVHRVSDVLRSKYNHRFKLQKSSINMR